MSVSSKPSGPKISQKDMKALLKNRSQTSKTKIVQGDTISGIVSGSGQQGVFVRIEGSDIFGRIRLSDISARFISGDEAKKLMPVGTKLKDLVVSSVDASSGRIELKPQSRLGDPELGSIHKAIVKRVEKYGVIMSFPNSLIKGLCVKEDLDDDEDNCVNLLSKIQAGHKYNVKVIRIEQGKIWVSMKPSVLGTSFSVAYDQPVMEFVEAHQPSESAEVESATLIEEGEVSRPSQSATKRVVRDALEVEDEIEQEAGNRKKAKRQREAQKNQKEVAIREKEEHLMSGEWRKNPETAEEFERLMLEDKSASVWIKYMSHWLKMAEVAKARETAERGLRQDTMSESDKFNLWIAYLNMEAAFGSDADQLFARAAQYCDTKKIYHALPQVYVRAGQVTKAITSFERMCAKFPSCRKAWMNYVEYLFNSDRLDEARTVFAKALKNLPKHKHVRATTKFAQLEFRSGNSERGTSVFERLIQAGGNVARTDIWSIFFDETIRACTPPVVESSADLATVRALFEKALSTKLKPKKMKSFFKRWLDFETKFGTDEDIQTVKNRAVEYVESIGGSDE